MRRVNRREFLGATAVAASAVAIHGCATVKQTRGPGAAVRVKIDAPNEGLVARTFAILKDRIEYRGGTRVVAVKSRADVILAIDDSLPTESFRFEDAGKALRVAGGSPQGLLYGIGKLLRTSSYDDATFHATAWRGTSSPRGSGCRRPSRPGR